MLNYFRSTDPYRLLGLFLLMLLLFLPWLIDWPGMTLPELKSIMVGQKVRDGFLMYTEITDRTPPLAAWFYGLCQWLVGKSLTGRHILAGILLFFFSAYYGLLLISKRAFPESTLVPAFVFSILLMASFDMLALTAELPAFGFLLIALKLLFDEVEFREHRDETDLNLGLSLGLASLLVFTYALFLPGVIIILLLFTRLSLRRFFLLLFGFMLPHGLLTGFYHYRHSLNDLLERFYHANLYSVSPALLPVPDLLILFSVPLFFLFLSFFVLNRNARLTKYQSQLLQIMMLWLAIAVIHTLLANDLRPQSFLPAVPALSFLLTHHFLLIKRRFAEIHIWLFLAGTVALAYLAQYEMVPVRYEKLLVQTPGVAWKDKRVLDLSGNLTVFIYNTPAPPFTDPELTNRIFSQPNTYESVILVEKLFRLDPPDVVLDPENKLAAFTQRIPDLEKKYERRDSTWIRKVSN